MDLTYRDIVEILKIADSSGFSQVTIEDGSFRLSIARGESASVDGLPAPAGAAGQAPAPAAAVPAEPPSSPPADDEAPTLGQTERRVTIGGVERSVARPAAQVDVSPTAVAVSAPMLGVFYRAPSPGAPPYAEIGQHVNQGDTLCLVEAMKMFMPVHAPTAGVVVALPVENAALVEFGQPIAYLEPDTEG